MRGVDRSARRVRGATARVGLDPEGRVAFKQGSPRALPYPDGFFDLVAQIDGQPPPAEAARVLRPGGHLILASSAPPGLLAGLRTRRLLRHGFEPVAGEAAGDGSFSVVRLRGAGRAGGAD